MVAACKLRRAQTAGRGRSPLCRAHGADAGALAATLPVTDRAAAAGGDRQGQGPAADRGDRRSWPCRRVQHVVGRPPAAARRWKPRAKPSRSWPSAARGATTCGGNCAAGSSAIQLTPAGSRSNSPTRRTSPSACDGDAGGWRVRRRDAVYNRFQSVIAQVVTEQQLIPAPAPQQTRRRRPRCAIYEFEPDEETILASCCRRRWRCRFTARCWRVRPASMARA